MTEHEGGSYQKSARTVQRILDAAKQEFGERGIQACTIESIAARAHISKQLVYHYYGNKDALYADVLEAVSIEIHGRYFNIDFDGLPPVEAFTRFLNLMFDLNIEYDYAYTSDQVSHHGSYFKNGGKAVELGRKVVALLGRILERGVATGDFRAGLDPHYIYLMIFLLIPGFHSARDMASCYLRTDFRSEEAGRRWRAQAVDTLLRTVRAL
jgi:TetR/AcrR family transcriptional regulator